VRLRTEPWKLEKPRLGLNPKLIGTEAEIPFGKPQTLLRDRKTLAKPPSHPIGKAEAISNRRSQGLVVGSVCLLNGLQKQIESFFDDASKQPDHAEAVQHLTADVTIPAPLG
jgi:hypothetical protein